MAGISGTMLALLYIFSRPIGMVLKSFAAARHSRVVFYDHDMICYFARVISRNSPVREEGSFSS
ncbi:MAG: hypothetical protein HOC70_07125 [Gammaproteobacteria bacterium]|nr:hypothetical protein [Gammaproteobacteria bacterium]MBT4492999.1 hypothetical protein [Gammaproteobacteria bacterium]MBT7370846.1 hypothetical protein [Gammaproteobacteria bacterium]